MSLWNIVRYCKWWNWLLFWNYMYMHYRFNTTWTWLVYEQFKLNMQENFANLIKYRLFYALHNNDNILYDTVCEAKGVFDFNF
jgi:hypothetical protein